jgi:hypothetical protein
VLVIVDTAGKAAGYAKAEVENDAVLGQQVGSALAETSGETGALFLGVDHFGKALRDHVAKQASRSGKFATPCAPSQASLRHVPEYE